MDAEMLKIARDGALKEVGEASARANDAERRAQDAKMALRKSIEENFRLLGIKEALTRRKRCLRLNLLKPKHLQQRSKSC
ncbi:hypothetical protein COCNU_06G017540 [Cocos nucifera]|uniref:Uncharacterized protein n=1 Tax=Cocos nucifera TaxID=13894 RepID=A0A8K0IDA0_COCNU|nr:hypothetical protein COCNU_06G017540 [Cocos nucifera]